MCLFVFAIKARHNQIVVCCVAKLSDHCCSDCIWFSGDTKLSSYWTQFLFIIRINQVMLYVLGEHVSEHVFCLCEMWWTYIVSVKLWHIVLFYKTQQHIHIVYLYVLFI